MLIIIIGIKAYFYDIYIKKYSTFLRQTMQKYSLIKVTDLWELLVYVKNVRHLNKVSDDVTYPPLVKMPCVWPSLEMETLKLLLPVPLREFFRPLRNISALHVSSIFHDTRQALPYNFLSTLLSLRSL